MYKLRCVGISSLVLGAVLYLGCLAPAEAQGNPQCPTRPAGDSSNACASTAFVSNAQGTELVFPTKAAAAAAFISPTINIVATLGYTSAGDNGGAEYVRVASTTAASWRFQSADGQWWSLNNQTVSPEMFGIVGDGSTNNTTAFNQMCSWIETYRPGATVLGKPSADYRVWPSDPGAPALCDLSNTNGVTFDMRGAWITSAAATFTGLPTVFYLRNNNINITFNNFKYRQLNHGIVAPASTGAIVFYVVNNLTNMTVNNLSIAGATSGIAGARNNPFTRASNITLSSANFFSVYYPMNFQKNGDNFTATDVNIILAGRAYFPYNVKNHNVSFKADYFAIIQPTILIKTYADAAESAELNTTSDITVNAVLTSSQALAAPLSYVNIDFQQDSASTASATMNNIRVNIDAVANTIPSLSTAMKLTKYTQAGAIDTTTRGYVLDNVVFTGHINFANGLGTTLSAFDLAGSGDWTGETVRNFVVRDFISIGSIATNSFVLDLTSLTGPFTFENVTANLPFSLTGAGTNFRPININDGGTTADRQAVIPSTAAANNFLTGLSTSGALTAAQPSFSNLSGSLACSQTPALTGDVTTSAGSCATTIANSAVSNAKMADMAESTIKGRAAGAGTGAPTDLTAAQVSAILPTRTRQVFLSGSGTYTTPANVKYIAIRLAGAGGGGAGGGTADGGAGGAGGNTTFGTNTANGGNGGAGGASTNAGSGGGTSACSTGSTFSVTGGPGGNGNSGASLNGGNGGASTFGGIGWFGTPAGASIAGSTNSGSGGGGGGTVAGGTVTGGGGGAGGYLECIIPSPSATYSYGVGAAGTAGAAGTNGNAGAQGGSGNLTVDEYYQ